MSGEQLLEERSYHLVHRVVTRPIRLQKFRTPKTEDFVASDPQRAIGLDHPCVPLWVGAVTVRLVMFAVSVA
jgi:hypothetical protein